VGRRATPHPSAVRRATQTRHESNPTSCVRSGGRLLFRHSHEGADSHGSRESSLPEGFSSGANLVAPRVGLRSRKICGTCNSAEITVLEFLRHSQFRRCPTAVRHLSHPGSLDLEMSTPALCCPRITDPFYIPRAGGLRRGCCGLGERNGGSLRCRPGRSGRDWAGWRRPARAANPSTARRISSLRQNVPT
jgi:hypothetical protein